MRRGSILSLVGIGILAGGIATAVAVLLPWLPPVASKDRVRIDDLFWVPEFGQKEDTVPGLDTQLHITPTKVGTYDVICTELCGLGHATMRSQAIVMPAKAFDAWLKSQTKATTSPNTAVSGAAVFKN